MGESRKGSAGHWRELSRTLPVAYARLVTDLRELKDRSRLNLARLAEATAISTSSWERYLNGKQFPPRYAVQALCRAAREPEEAILAQWDLADAAWSRRGDTVPRDAERTRPEMPRAEAAASGGPRPRSGAAPLRRVLLVASAMIDERPRTAAAGVLFLCAAMITPSALLYASRPAAPSTTDRPPVCLLRSCEGRNPRTTACEDPTTVSSHTAADGTLLEIRLSPSCRAAWIRTRPAHAGFRIEITGPGAHARTTVGAKRPTDREIITTTMIAAPRPSALRGCYYPSPDAPDRECFGGGQRARPS